MGKQSFDHMAARRAKKERHDRHYKHPIYEMLMAAGRNGHLPRPEDVEALKLPQRLADRLYVEAHKVARTYHDRDRGATRLMDARRQADRYANRMLEELAERFPLYRTPEQEARDNRSAAEIAAEARKRSFAMKGGRNV